jgi:hypothetical protein
LGTGRYTNHGKKARGVYAVMQNIRCDSPANSRFPGDVCFLPLLLPGLGWGHVIAYLCGCYLTKHGADKGMAWYGMAAVDLVGVTYHKNKK